MNEWMNCVTVASTVNVHNRGMQQNASSLHFNWWIRVDLFNGESKEKVNVWAIAELIAQWRIWDLEYEGKELSEQLEDFMKFVLKEK